MPIEPPAPRTIVVAADHFEIASDDVIFSAEVASTVVVCLYDAVEEPGAVINLRFVTRGEQHIDLTDRTLATYLLLLDRCVAELRRSTPRAQNLQGKIAAHVDSDATPAATTDGVLGLVTSYLEDAGVVLISRQLSAQPANLRFRPAMGQLHLEYSPIRP